MKTQDNKHSQELNSGKPPDKQKAPEAKTQAAKKELQDEPGKEKFEGTLRHKTGENDR